MAKSTTKQKRKRTRKDALISRAVNLTVGAPSGASMEFAVQIRIKDPQKAFQIELPGAVYHLGRAFTLGILPIARIRAGAGKTARVATVHFAEKSETLTRKALTTVQRVILRKRPRTFSLLIEGGRMTFSDVLDAAANGGSHDKKLPIGTVNLRMQFGLAGGAVIRSDPIPGLIAADLVSPPEDDDDDDVQLKGIFDPWYIFDCHSEWCWDGAALRWFTVCKGDCDKGGPCSQGDPPKRAAWGCNFCWC